jgi:hypothetical protein
MTKVKTFTSPLKVFHAKQALDRLDEQVNTFVSGKAGRRVVSVSDTCTTDDNGSTMGIIRVVTYEEAG